MLILLSLSFPLFCHAIVGEYVNSSLIPDSTCKLIIDAEDENGPYKSLCSGTLVKNDKILTAAHCNRGDNQRNSGHLLKE